jgi:hypothetical protein
MLLPTEIPRLWRHGFYAGNRSPSSVGTRIVNKPIRQRLLRLIVVLANRAARPSVVTFTVFGHYGSGQFGSGGSTAGRSRAVLQARR